MGAQQRTISERRLAELAGALAGREIVALERIGGGRNNRAYRADTSAGPFFLKAYHSDQDDSRPRLRTEIAFLKFAWSENIRTIPEPIAADVENNLGLYGFIAGEQLHAGQVEHAHIDQAAAFLSALNHGRQAPPAAALPPASEACFSFAAHIQLIEDRVRRLETMHTTTATEGNAEAFVREQLVPLWKRVARRVREQAQQVGIPDEQELPASQRCLSPSDFGFHNAIEESSGRLIFHDFEYAGWDDPAKVVCDFICQPEVPVGAADRAFAVDRLLAALEAQHQHCRVELLYPAYLLKWCCICLNDFLPGPDRRRNFAEGSGGADRKQAQLAKAEALLETAAQHVTARE